MTVWRIPPIGYYDHFLLQLLLPTTVSPSIIIFFPREILGQDSAGYWSGLLLPPVYVERIQTGFHHSGIPSYNASHCTTLTCCVSEENYEAQEANEDKVWIHCGHLKSRRICTNHSDFLTRTTHSHFHRLGKNIPTPT